MNTILTVLTIILHSVTTHDMNRPDIHAHDTRPNACRTYNIGGYDMTDGLNCRIVPNDHRSDSKQITQNNDTVPSNETVIVATDNPVSETIVIDVPVQNNDKPKSNNGNHYGNDNPDNNPKDTKNKHNGCDKDCTGKDNPGKNKDK